MLIKGERIMAKKLYGAGTISKTADGKYKWRGHYVDKTTGKQHRPTKTFNTKKEAEEYREFVFKSDYMQTINTPKITFEIAYKKWQDEIWKVSGNLSENTIRGYVGIFSKHLLTLLGNTELKKINPDKIQRYYNLLKTEGLSHKTIKNINQALDALFQFCIKKQLLTKNPLDSVYIPKDSMKKRAEKTQFKDAISEKEFYLVSNCFSGIYQYALLFIAFSGIRPEELAIKKEDVDFEKEEIYIRRAVKREIVDYKNYKTQKIESEDLKSIKAYRTLPLTVPLKSIIYKQLKYLEKEKIDSIYIFPNSRGNLPELRNLLRSFHNACEKAGIDKRGVKCLRKYYITRKIKEGIDPKTLQYLVGHESITTTLSFYQILDMEDVKCEVEGKDIINYYELIEEQARMERETNS